MTNNKHDERGAFVAPGSETSAAAADRIEGKASKLEQMVFDAINAAGPDGLADFEIDALVDEHLARGATARPRRCKLRDRGLIVDCGDSVLNPETNRRQTRWVAAGHFSPPIRGTLTMAGYLAAQVPDPLRPATDQVRAEGKAKYSPGTLMAAWADEDEDPEATPVRLTSSPVERILRPLMEDLEVCRTYWSRPDMMETDRLDRMAHRLELRALEFRRQADRLKRETEWTNTGQASLALDRGGC